MSVYTKDAPVGTRLEAISSASTIAIGAASLNELESCGLLRPTDVERATIKSRAADKSLSAVHDLRDQVQRRFDKKRRERAQAYADYMLNIASERLDGGVPPITLYCALPCTEVEGGILIPRNAPLVNLDGETQTEARFIMRDLDSSTGKHMVPFVLYHGIGVRHAGNIMHDVNAYAHPVTEASTAPLNSNGSVTQAVNEAITASGIPSEMVNRHGSAILKSHITSFDRLIAAVLGYTAGSSALRRNGIPALLARYNTGAQSIDKEAVQPMLAHFLALAQANRVIAKASPAVWTAAGSVSRERRALISEADFASATTAYNSVKGREQRNLALAKSLKMQPVL